MTAFVIDLKRAIPSQLQPAHVVVVPSRQRRRLNWPDFCFESTPVEGLSGLDGPAWSSKNESSGIYAL